jgi:hypothetical protein
VSGQGLEAGHSPAGHLAQRRDEALVHAAHELPHRRVRADGLAELGELAVVIDQLDVLGADQVLLDPAQAGDRRDDPLQVVVVTCRWKT